MMKRGFSVMRGPVDGHDCDGDDGCEYGREHDNDEPGGAVGRLRGGLGDPHGVDKGVRDEVNELHVSSMVSGRDSSRNPSRYVVLEWLNRKGVVCIY
jgi:hypothetical protein